MRRNLDYGAQWAARILMAKRGLAGDLTVEEAERVFRFAIDPATYRTLTGELGLDDDGVASGCCATSAACSCCAHRLRP